MEFEKKKIEIEVFIPVGFDISKMQVRQMHINQLTIATKQTGYIDNVTRYGRDMIAVDFLLTSNDSHQTTSQTPTEHRQENKQQDA